MRTSHGESSPQLDTEHAVLAQLFEEAHSIDDVHKGERCSIAGESSTMLASGVISVDVRGDCDSPGTVSVHHWNSIVDWYQLSSIDVLLSASGNLDLVTLLHPAFP